MAPNLKHPGWGGRRPGAGGKPGRRKLPMPEMPGVRLFDPRPIALRARDYTHLALAGLVRTLCDPEAPHAAVVNAAREMLDRGYGRAVELKRTVSMGAFDRYSDAELVVRSWRWRCPFSRRREGSSCAIGAGGARSLV